MMKTEKRLVSSQKRDTTEKKKYSSPHLTKYGSVKELTAGGKIEVGADSGHS